MQEEVKAHVANKRSHLKTILKWLLFCLFLVILQSYIYTAQVSIDGMKTASLKDSEFLYLPYHKNIGRFNLGFNEIMSDILYIKAINYFGKHYLSDKDYPYLYQILDAATDLSPQFKDPYEFGAIILTLEAKEIEKSNALLYKAISNNPHYWRFPFYLSFNYFFFLGDFEKAALYMERASTLPDSPGYLPKLTARLYAHSGRPEVALDFLYRIYEDIEDKKLKEEISIRIKEVVIERDIQCIEEALKRYKSIYKKMPRNLQELKDKGIINKIPVEPFDGYYYINSKGEISSSAYPERLRLYLN